VPRERDARRRLASQDRAPLAAARVDHSDVANTWASSDTDPGSGTGSVGNLCDRRHVKPRPTQRQAVTQRLGCTRASAHHCSIEDRIEVTHGLPVDAVCARQVPDVDRPSWVCGDPLLGERLADVCRTVTRCADLRRSHQRDDPRTDPRPTSVEVKADRVPLATDSRRGDRDEPLLRPVVVSRRPEHRRSRQTVRGARRITGRPLARPPAVRAPAACAPRPSRACPRHPRPRELRPAAS